MIKALRKLSLVFLFVVMFITTFDNITVHASESNMTDQVSTTVMTDKDSYNEGEIAVITIVVENKKNVRINDVNINVVLPNDLELAEGKTSVKFPSINANGSEKIVLKAECVDRNVLDIIETGVNTSIGTFITVLILSGVIILIILYFKGKNGGNRKPKNGKRVLTIFLCLLLVSTNLTIVQATQLKKMLSVNKKIELNGEAGSILVSVDFKVDEMKEENNVIKINVDHFTYSEEDDVYLLTKNYDKLTGTMKEVDCLVSATYKILDFNGGVLLEGEIKPDSNWTLSNIGYVVGENHIQVTAIDKNGKTYQDNIVVVNTVEENMDNLGLDKGDTDKDGVLNYIEDINNTDKNNADTDGDGLTDYDEIGILGTNPLKKDTNNNKVLDSDEDFDGDTLTNFEEIKKGLNPISKDSDYEGLQDNIELDIQTNPLKEDTDGDGINDYYEYKNGTDPLTPEDPKEVVKQVINNESMSIIGADVTQTLEIEASREDLATLKIDVVSNEYINSALPGYIGEAYDFTMDGTFKSAKLSMEFDEKLLNKEGFNPVIYYLNPETKELEEIPTVVNGNVATANIEHFSTYILLDKTAFDKIWDTEIRPPEYTGEDQKSGLDVVLAIDSSGSMDDNDRNGLRKAAAKLFVNRLGEKDRAAIVDFDYSAIDLSGLSNDKEQLATAIDRIDNYGGTNLTGPIAKGIDILTADASSKNKYKYIILLTDGNGNYNKDYSRIAVENDVQIFTIGLGSDIDESLLKDIAEDTDGKYYFASSADDLLGIYDSTAGETIDYVTDSNNDGISDYYTKLLADGKLRISTGLRVFGIASYEEIQANDDFDGDGLKNGEEIEVTRSADGTKIYAYKKSSPISVNSDQDQYGDYKEVRQNGTDPMKKNVWINNSHLDDLKNDENYVSNKYKDFYDDEILGALEKGSIWLGTHFFGTEYDHSMLYKNQFADYFYRIKKGYTNSGEDSKALDLARNLASQIFSGINEYADGYITYLDIPKNSAKALKELQDKAMNLEKMYLNASASGFSSKEDFYKYADDLYSHYCNAKLELDAFKSDLKLSLDLGKVKKVSETAGNFLVVVDVVVTWKNIYDDYSNFVNQMDIMKQNIYVYDAIINGDADDDVKAAASDIRNILQKDYDDSYDKVWNELGYKNQITTSTIGKAGHLLAGQIPYVNCVEKFISIADFCLNLSGVSKECLKLNGIASTARVLADDYNNYRREKEKLNAFINLLFARLEAEQQMRDAVHENTWLTEWIFKYFMYKDEDTNENINYLSGILPFYLEQLESI